MNTSSSAAIRPFRYHATDADLDELRRRVEAMHWPERETVADDSQGVQLATIQARLDELLASYAEGWTLTRMPAVDRNVLRLGLWELLYADDVPDAVAVSEAMALVRDLSTDESPQFVNGVLGNLQRNKASL